MAVMQDAELLRCVKVLCAVEDLCKVHCFLCIAASKFMSRKINSWCDGVVLT